MKIKTYENHNSTIGKLHLHKFVMKILQPTRRRRRKHWGADALCLAGPTINNKDFIAFWCFLYYHPICSCQHKGKIENGVIKRCLISHIIKQRQITVGNEISNVEYNYRDTLNSQRNVHSLAHAWWWTALWLGLYSWLSSHPGTPVGPL